MRDDEEFAKQLQLKEKYPKAMQKTTPNNLNDIMQMEYAWKAYKAEVDEWKNSTPQDLASQMTRSKLFEIFPSVNRETLVEVLAAHDNKFAKTVEVLKDSLGSDINNQVEVESQRLLNQARIEVQAVCIQIKFFFIHSNPPTAAIPLKNVMPSIRYGLRRLAHQSKPYVH